jgi:acetylornithine deacetylase
VILGPGDLALAHSPRESVPVAELAAAARIYAATALAFCPAAAR